MWRNPAFHRFLDALLLLAIVIVALFPLVSGTNTMKWDATDLYLPWKYYVTECFANGELPLWNPFINSGFPQMADPGSWYPVSWILAWLGGGYSLNVLHWEYIIHLFIGGFGMYSLLRHCLLYTSDAADE